MKSLIKQRLKSSTYWFNIVVGLFAAAPQLMTVLEPFVTPGYYTTLTMVLTLGNLFFREITKVPLSKK